MGSLGISWMAEQTGVRNHRSSGGDRESYRVLQSPPGREKTQNSGL